MKLKQIRPKDLLKALLKAGFIIKRQKGSHVFLELAILKQTGLSEDSLRDLL